MNVKANTKVVIDDCGKVVNFDHSFVFNLTPALSIICYQSLSRHNPGSMVCCAKNVFMQFRLIVIPRKKSWCRSGEDIEPSIVKNTPYRLFCLSFFFGTVSIIVIDVKFARIFIP